MNDRATEERTPEGFVRRWSQRKRAVARGEAPPEPTRAEPHEAAPPQLPDPATLTLADDFSAFLRERVPEALKRRAMRQLFADPHFNQIDGLDVYLEDFNEVPELTAAELPLLAHARAVLDPGAGEEEEHLADSGDEATNAPPPAADDSA